MSLANVGVPYVTKNKKTSVKTLKHWECRSFSSAFTNPSCIFSLVTWQDLRAATIYLPSFWWKMPDGKWR